MHFKSFLIDLCLGCVLFIEEGIEMSTVTSELLKVLHIFIPIDTYLLYFIVNQETD